jgi:SAM-dependent methyltransferase
VQPEAWLIEAAPLQLRLAERWCDDSCRWYHGPRGYLQAFQIMRGVRRDSAFMNAALTREAARRGASRVLVSGAADWFTLAHAAAAYRAGGAAFSATIVDRCRTPLDINAWYARKAALDVRLVRADILRFRAARPFDVIVTHSFFSFFDDHARRRLMRQWRRLLAPGGSIVTVHGTYRSRAALAAAEAARARVYRQRVRDLDEAHCQRLGIDKPTLLAWVETHNRRRAHRPVRSVAALRRLFEEGGFRITRLTVEDVGRIAGIRRVGLVAEREP